MGDLDHTEEKPTNLNECVPFETQETGGNSKQISRSQS